MGTKIKLTEGQIERMMKNLVSEQSAPGVGKFQKGQYQGYKTYDYKATGSDLFKNGQFEINPNNFEIINLVSKIQQASTESSIGGTTVTINGGASNTSWGGNPAGSPEAVKKNQELAQKRIDSLRKYLESKNLGAFITYAPGIATVGKVGSKDPEKDQFVSVSIVGKGTEGKINVDRDNTSIQYNNYPKNNVVGGGGGKPNPKPSTTKMKRVCIKIPANLVDSYRLKVREFSKTNKLGDIPFGVYDVK